MNATMTPSFDQVPDMPTNDPPLDRDAITELQKPDHAADEHRARLRVITLGLECSAIHLDKCREQIESGDLKGSLVDLAVAIKDLSIVTNTMCLHMGVPS